MLKEKGPVYCALCDFFWVSWCELLGGDLIGTGFEIEDVARVGVSRMKSLSQAKLGLPSLTRSRIYYTYLDSHILNCTILLDSNPRIFDNVTDGQRFIFVG